MLRLTEIWPLSGQPMWYKLHLLLASHKFFPWGLKTWDLVSPGKLYHRTHSAWWQWKQRCHRSEQRLHWPACSQPPRFHRIQLACKLKYVLHVSSTTCIILLPASPSNTTLVKTGLCTKPFNPRSYPSLAKLQYCRGHFNSLWGWMTCNWTQLALPSLLTT